MNYTYLHREKPNSAFRLISCTTLSKQQFSKFLLKNYEEICKAFGIKTLTEGILTKELHLKFLTVCTLALRGKISIAEAYNAYMWYESKNSLYYLQKLKCKFNMTSDSESDSYGMWTFILNDNSRLFERFPELIGFQEKELYTNAFKLEEQQSVKTFEIIEKGEKELVTFILDRKFKTKVKDILAGSFTKNSYLKDQIEEFCKNFDFTSYKIKDIDGEKCMFTLYGEYFVKTLT